MRTFPAGSDNFLSSYNWNFIFHGIDNRTLTVDNAQSNLLNVHHNVANVLGYEVFTIHDSEPHFVTPEVKISLRKHKIT